MAAPVTVSGIKARLVGLDGWLAAAAASMAQYDDDRIEADIPARIRRFERETQWRINQVQVCSDADSMYATGDSYYVEGRYPYYRSMGFNEWMLTTLRCRPVQQVQRVRLFIGSQQIVTLPSEWIRVDSRSGRMWVIPVSGSATANLYVSAMAMFGIGQVGNEHLPEVISVDYLAGLPTDWQDNARLGVEWSDLIHALEDMCALEVLRDIAELYDAGLMGKSIGADGASQSLNYDRFERRKQELDAQVQSFIGLLRDQEVPVSLTAI